MELLLSGREMEVQYDLMICVDKLGGLEMRLLGSFPVFQVRQLR